METLAVRVTPKAHRNEVGDVVHNDDGTCEVVVRVTSAPEGGKANRAVCEAIARSLGVAKSKVSVTRGCTSRHKLLLLDIPTEVFQLWFDQLESKT